MRTALLLFLGSLAFGVPASQLDGPTAGASRTDAPDFATEVEPILRRCTRCHSGHQTKGGFSIDTRERLMAGGLSGPAVVVADSANSLLVELIRSDDADERMPQDGEPLNTTEIRTIERWIDAGVPWPNGFAFTNWRRAPLAPRDVTLPIGQGHAIDRLLAAHAIRVGFEAPQEIVSDRVFARRVWFDTIGLLPPPDALDAFVNSTALDKRAQLVDRLLDDRVGFAEHWLTFFSDLLRNDDRGTGYIDGGRRSVTAWLYRSLHDNVSMDRFVRELIDPVPGSEGFIAGIRWRGVVNESQRPAMQAAQNVAQVFLGTNLKCASCHDSFVNYWKLSDAYGFAAAFSEEPLEQHRCDRPLGKPATPSFLFRELGELTPGADRATRLKEVANLVVDPRNGRFARTWVNRIWDRLLGVGMVAPVDDLDQPAFDSDLLDWLANDFVASGYDQRHLLKRILTSQAYQRPSRPEELTVGAGIRAFRGPLARRLSAEQFVDAVSTLTATEPGMISAALPGIGGSDELSKLRWIWRPVPDAKNVARETVEFTKTFDLTAAPTSARVIATCDNEFELELNGHAVVSSKEWTKPVLADVSPWIRSGANTLRVVGTNISPGPAGLALILITDQGEASTVIVSDATWRTTLLGDNESESQLAQVVGEANGWNLGGRFAALARRGSRPVRAALVANDRLLTALGRPNREQVVTCRDERPTTLQALELVNGAMLHERLLAGGAFWMAKHDEATSIVDGVFRLGFGRRPNPAEREIALELLGSEPTAEAVADLLWIVLVHPDFQFIR